MDRKKILVTAGAITATVLAGTAAVAANVGLLNSTGDSGVGDLSPVVATDTAPASTNPVETETIFVDEPAPATAPATGSSSPAATTAPTAPSAQSNASSFDDDHGDDDHGDESDDHEDESDDHEDESEEHEGRDDDD